MGAKEIHLIVSGRVQGVGFRSLVKWYAEQYQVKGFVRNLEDGRVEICAQGERVEEFVKKVREDPGMAQIDQIERKMKENKNVYDSFKILR